MLEDFIEVNNLDSKIIKVSTDTAVGKAVSSKLIPPNLAVDIKLFNSGKNDPLLVVVPHSSEIDFSVVNELLEGEAIEMDERETIDITGYKKNCLPPISIYGIRIVIDSSLENKEYLFCKSGEKQFLKASMKDILETNDDVSFKKITI